MNKRIKEKLKTLKEVVRFFYGRYTLWVVLRDILFLAITVAEMYNIKVMGSFLDSMSVLLEVGVEKFDIREFILTDAFFFLMMILLLWIVVNIGNKIRANLYTNMNDEVWSDCNLEMVNKISKSNLQDIMDPKFQDLVAYVPEYSIENMILSYQAFSNIVSQGIRMITALTIMFIDMRFSILFLGIFVLPEVIMGYIQRKKIRTYNAEEVGRLKIVNYLSKLARDNTFFSELRVDNTFRHIKNTLRNEDNEYQRGLFERRKHLYIDTIATSVFGQVLKYGYIIYVIGYALVKRLTIGTFSALFNYTTVAYNSAFNIFNTVALLSDRLSYASRFFELVQWKGFGDIKYGTEKLPEKSLTLKFDDLDFAYPDQPGRKILENINLEINSGEKVAFLGGDSSGKSSLVKLLTGMYEILIGDYVISGYSIRELKRGELKKHISVVFQNFINYNFSLEKNITIGLDRKNVDRGLYEKVLKITNLDKLMKKDGIEDKRTLGRYFSEGLELSPGYWQRIAIARMLYRNKEIFIMDEPFTFIDSKSKSKIINGVIDFVGKKRILIYITRSTEDLEKFDRVYYFENGHMVESGPWKELLKKRGRTYKGTRTKKKK
ncbi:ABC transporter ATP-binding protein/permease [bacterium]|nr:ABC transporter ATP-binding protein/permease [bacterium]